MSDPALSKDHVTAIGQLVVNMTRIESVVVDLLSIFMGCNILNAIIAFYPTNFSSKMDTLKALYSPNMTKEEREGDPTIKLFNTVSELGEFRNAMVHAHWAIGPSGKATAVRFPTRGGKFSRTTRALTAKEIQEKATKAREVEATLRGLRDHLRSA